MCQKCVRNMLGMCQVCVRNVSGKCQECIRNVSAMSSECVICMLVVCQKGFGNVLGVSKESGMSQVCIMKVLGIC